MTEATFRLIKSEVLPLTHELAEEFRALEPSPTERDLDPARVKHLREKAEAGRLITFQWAKARLGNRLLRMNGQHSSAMLCELNGQFPQGLKAHVDEYEVSDPSGLAVLFRQFDDKKSSRSTGDVAGAYQGLYDNLRGVPKHSAKLAVDGVAWFRRNVEGVPVPSDSPYLLFGETGLHSFITWMGELFESKTRELQKASVVAAMYATFVANEAEGRKFWHQVARGGPEYEDHAPSTQLDGWLKQANEQPDFRRTLKPGNFYQACIFAWNAFRQEKQLDAIKSDLRKGFAKVIE